MANPLYLATLRLPLTEKPVTPFSAENQATYMDIFNLQNTFKIVLQNFTEEAPQDGKQYARKDGAWVEVTGGGGTTDVRLTSSTSVVDVNAINISVPISSLAAVGDLLLIIGFARSNVIAPVGWTLVANSDIIESNQRQYLLSKTATASDIGTSVTVNQTTSGRLGAISLSVFNAKIDDVSKGRYPGLTPFSFTTPTAVNKGIYVLSASALLQVEPSNFTVSGVTQLTPTTGATLRNLVGVKPVNALDTIAITINSTTSAENICYLNIFLGPK